MIRLLTLASVFSLLAGCSCLIPVFVSGSLEDGIVFSFRDAARVSYAEVLETETGQSWTTNWEVRGRRKIDAITYGNAPNTFDIVVQPVGLQAGRMYMFQAETAAGRGLFRSPCVGGITFTIDAKGRPVVCSALEDCAQAK